jgi:two-component system, OmpR family, response regulator
MELISSKSISLDLLKREVFREGVRIELHTREILLLELFLRNPGKVLTKDEILRQIWKYNFNPGTNVVDVLICRLRRKIDRPFGSRAIRTIHGIGYTFLDV